MTHGVTTGSLFRRPRRWPWVIGVLLLAVGFGVAVGASLLDDDPVRRGSLAAPSRTPDSQPSPSPSGQPEPTEASTPSPLPSSAEEATPAPSPEPTPTAPPTSGTAASATASPRRPSATSSRTPSSAGSSGFPPPGLRLDVTASKTGANRARIRIRVRDTDGRFNGGFVDFGDGTSRQFPQGTATCSGETSGPYQPSPSDRTIDVIHDYPSKGTYDVFVRVRTDNPCAGTPVEQASKVVSVTVDDATPGPTPTPILTPGATA